jgi:hypothetical protein
MWPAWRVGKHKGAQTAIGPSQSPSRSVETARPVGRACALGQRFWDLEKERVEQKRNVNIDVQ